MEKLREGGVYTGTVEGYSSEGLGIVRLDGAVVFVPGGPGGDRRSEDHQSDENCGGGGDREDPPPLAGADGAGVPLLRPVRRM